jgi:cation diffusion facilitator CzcD-associated flavoprotein CzcO
VTEVARLNSKVVAIAKQPSTGAWQIDVESLERGAYRETVDKVLICNGHFAAPAFAQIPGIDFFKGETLHSHNYRTAAPFKDKVWVHSPRGPTANT